jgi:hypothetical protein
MCVRFLYYLKIDFYIGSDSGYPHWGCCGFYQCLPTTARIEISFLYYLKTASFKLTMSYSNLKMYLLVLYSTML